ncbi:putative RND efflux membrane fusion protein [Fimbriiglobus ruber]|uniref:Putative RND efflux membrane fusion protein n=2 Tax=Fimbriiglobus ruber TaxID=1908690 RepID=A0A225DQ87_9BACT|nr:putative RND efflux membrane fusion protein [Fimbriiglobus ruber]
MGGLAAGGSGGCQKKANTVPPSDPPTVPVSKPVKRSVTDFVDYTGRTDGVQSVSVRARVTGYLTQMPFEEGAEVKKGDLLFEIDPRPYKAQLDQAEGQLALVKSQLKLAQVTYDRYLALKSSISAQELDQYKATVDQAVAQVEATKASLDMYKLNLEFTKVTAPIDGRVSRYYYTLGNLVTQDQTLLTTIVSMDPMYAYFDVEERTFQKLVKGINRSQTKTLNPAPAPAPKKTQVSADLAKPDAATGTGGAPGAAPPVPPAVAGTTTGVTVLMGLEGEEGYPHKGRLNFVNNQVNPSTGTVAVRALFDNPRPAGGSHSLIPGMFARIRMPLGEAHEALLVIDRAIGSDQGLKFVYVVDSENKVQYRRITTGALQDDGLRAVESGLNPDDQVVVGGIQQLRPKVEVKAEPSPMPTLNTGEAPTPSRKKPQPPAPGTETPKGPGGGKKKDKGGN